MAPDDHADDPDGHVTEQLESYLLGMPFAVQQYEVEAHLLGCARCRAEADTLSELAVAMASLTPEDVRAIESSRPPTGAARRNPDSAVREPSQPPTRPAGTRPGSRPGARRNRVRGSAVYAAVLVLGLVLGAAGGLWISPDSINGVPAGSESVDPGGRLSISLSDRDDGGTDVRAVVVGLRPGVPYELIAVGRDGRNRTVARGVAAGGPQTLLGRLDGPAEGVLFFAVAQADADVLFVAPAP